MTVRRVIAVFGDLSQVWPHQYHSQQTALEVCDTEAAFPGSLAGAGGAAWGTVL